MQLNILKKLAQGSRLSVEEVRAFISKAVEGKVPDAVIGAVLMGLATRSVSREELLGTVLGLYDLCETDFEAKDAIDTCGTGGSGLPKLNISSAVALVSAACGIRVAKHGNRSITGRAGSADVFWGAGWPQNISIKETIKCFQDSGFAFLFAPLFFPAMKAFAGVRRDLGIRTVFNLAGPLANPFRVGKQVVGVSDASVVQVYAEIIKELGRDAIIIYSSSGLDEIDLFSKTVAVMVKQGQIDSFEINPRDIVGDLIDKIDRDGLVSKGREHNIAIFREFVSGRSGDAFNLAVALNSAAVLMLCGRVDNMEQGFSMAMDMISSKAHCDKWNQILKLVKGVENAKG